MLCHSDEVATGDPRRRATEEEARSGADVVAIRLSRFLPYGSE